MAQMPQPQKKGAKTSKQLEIARDQATAAREQASANWSSNRISTVALVVSLLTAAFTAYQTFKVATDARYVSIIQSRIATCLALADYHGKIAGQGPDTSCDLKDKTKVSTSGCRLKQSANLGREMTLCVAKYQSVDLIKGCIDPASARYSVMDDVGGVDAELKPAC